MFVKFVNVFRLFCQKFGVLGFSCSVCAMSKGVMLLPAERAFLSFCGKCFLFVRYCSYSE